MAIRFVDKGPDDAPKKHTAPRDEPADTARAPNPEPEPPPNDAPIGEADIVPLAHAKPEPKPRGRKKPISAAPKPDKPADSPPSSEGDGFLPGLQVHAKPPPKPRGRKKAFG